MTEFVSTAFLRQARADYQSFLLLREKRQPASQWLHFLQMAVEKTGKVYEAHGIAAKDVTDLKKTHASFKKFVQKLGRFSEHLLPALQMRKKSQMKAHIQSVVAFAGELDKMNPQLAKEGPNVEYPWNIPNKGGVGVPCDHDFDKVVSTLNTAKGRAILKILYIV